MVLDNITRLHYSVFCIQLAKYRVHHEVTTFILGLKSYVGIVGS